MKRPRADHPFHVSQLFIILDRTELLLDVFSTGLEDGTYPRSSVELVSLSTVCSNQKKLTIETNQIHLHVPILCALLFFSPND
jgi:nuclear pore complex protein Nup107